MDYKEGLEEWNRMRKDWLPGGYLEQYGSGDIGDESVFEKLYKEGEEAFNSTLSIHERNPYIDNKGYLSEWRCPWFYGFRNAKKKYFEEKYKIPELQKALRELIFSYGLSIEYDDEYGTPYGITPEGYVIALGDKIREAFDNDEKP